MTIIDEVYNLYAALWPDYPQAYTIRSFLDAQANILKEAYQEQIPIACVQISNWHPKWISQPTEHILQGTFTMADSRLTIAREYGFDDWAQVEARGDEALHVGFETAVNATVSGDVDLLQSLLIQSPDLIHRRSQFGHEATLLIYVAANGIETWRQKTPQNAVEIITILLEAGAEVTAKANVYNGHYDALTLLTSSAHPAQADLTAALAAELEKAG